VTYRTRGFYALLRGKEGDHINTKKREQYNETMNITGIHTISGTSPLDVLAVPADISQTVPENVKRKVRGQDETFETYLKINPNKLGARQKIITEYSKFTKAMTYILDGMGLAPEDFTIHRADLCFNSADPQSYTQYQKLHRLIICCVADTYNFTNCYSSQDLFTYDGLSIAIKNSQYELENYDKERESHGKDECKNRLELRSKKMKSTIEHEFIEMWMQKLDTAIKNYPEVQQRYNMNLERLYKLDLAKPKEQRRYLSLTAFLLQYQECIFCRGQMIDCCSAN
jgi:hypothetical protein